ncbi:MAG: hypothetical protein WCK89_24010, partial [bacterium]
MNENDPKYIKTPLDVFNQAKFAGAVNARRGAAPAGPVPLPADPEFVAPPVPEVGKVFYFPAPASEIGLPFPPEGPVPGAAASGVVPSDGSVPVGAPAASAVAAKPPGIALQITQAASAAVDPVR